MRKVYAVHAVLLLLLGASASRAQESAPSPPSNGTRLLFGPTARALPKGQVYFGVYEFLMPFVQVGVTDRVSLGGGTPLFFGIDESHRPFWVTPKVQLVGTETTAVAAGAIHVFAPGEGGGGIGYVVATRGTERGALTAGAGLGYDVHGGRTPVVMIGGEREMRRSLRFITENYIWKNGIGMESAGVRFCGQRLSADVALGVPIGLGETFAFPVVNFVYMF
jgi:hypothetical protein